MKTATLSYKYATQRITTTTYNQEGIIIGLLFFDGAVVVSVFFDACVNVSSSSDHGGPDDDGSMEGKEECRSNK